MSNFVKVHLGGKFSHQRIDGNEPRGLSVTDKVLNPSSIVSKAKVTGDALRNNFGGAFVSSIDAYMRHQQLMKHYEDILKDESIENQSQTDHDILKQNYRFVMSEDPEKLAKSWQQRMAWKYYKRLFREYALADLSRYKEGRVGLRWRTESEVVAGKGQFTCGNKRCSTKEDLRSYEVNFKYKEEGEVKNELVKVRACLECARKLFFRKIMMLRKEKGLSKAEAEDKILATSQAQKGKGQDGKKRKHLSKKERKKEKKRQRKNRMAQEDLMQELEEKLFDNVDTEEEKGKQDKMRAEEEKKTWSEPLKKEKTRADDMDDYFEDLFL